MLIIAAFSFVGRGAIYRQITETEMKRNIGVVQFGRPQINSLVAKIKNAPIKEWSPDLRLAAALLANDEKCSEKLTVELILDSVLAAQRCADSVNRRTKRNIRRSSMAELQAACRRIANCCKRSPAPLKKLLDATTRDLVGLDETIIDSEFIELLFEATAKTFSRFPSGEAAKTALRKRFTAENHYPPMDWMKASYDSLDREAHERCEATLRTLSKNTVGLTAETVFLSIASALDVDIRKRENHSENIVVITSYLEEIAVQWKKAGLKPTRAVHSDDPTYLSRFRRYSDLILTAVWEPWSKRHKDNLTEIRGKIYESHSLLPNAVQPYVSAALRKCDEGWLIGDYALRRALG